MTRSLNPATEELLQEYPEHSADQVHSALRAAERAFRVWRETSMAERGRLMRRVGQILRQRAAELSTLMVREMGKPIAQAEAELVRGRGRPTG